MYKGVGGLMIANLWLVKCVFNAAKLIWSDIGLRMS